MRYDLAVVGAGPSGLGAAIEVAKSGGKVIVIDDHPVVGGKLNIQLHEEIQKDSWWIGKNVAKDLKDQAESGGIEILTNTQVWTIDKGWRIYVSNTGGEETKEKVIESDALLLATGAIEKPLPLPGWTLPGVITVGAAQVLTNHYQIKPGNRVTIIGVDILSLSIARTMQLAGVDVEGIYIAPQNLFTKEISNPTKLFKHFTSLTKFAPSSLMRLGGMTLHFSIGRKIAAKFYPQRGMKAWGIPIHFRRSVQSINGEEQAESITTRKIDDQGNPIGGESVIEVDSVCISGGLAPQNELAEIVGCNFVRLHGLSGVVPLHSQFMETTVEGLFVAGNITGIESAKVALKQGYLAGKSIVNFLGLETVSSATFDKYIKRVNQARELADITFHPNVISARKELQAMWKSHSELQHKKGINT